jgi:hypothetical protein
VVGAPAPFLGRLPPHRIHPHTPLAPTPSRAHTPTHPPSPGKQVSKALTKFKEAPSMLYVGGFEVEPMNELPKADFDAGCVFAWGKGPCHAPLRCSLLRPHPTPLPSTATFT